MNETTTNERGNKMKTTFSNTWQEPKGTLKVVGYDGNSKEIIQLWMPCGCSFDKNKKNLIGSCMTHLTSEVTR